MKTFMATLALAAILTAMGFTRQGPPMPQPPKELKQIAWMKGEWQAEFNMFEGGKKVGLAKGPVSCADALGNMYLESRFETDMGGMQMKGLHLTSYDANKKEFTGYWFDNMSPGLLELRGKLKGQTLVMTSKPTSLPGMPGKVAFRSTNAMKSPTTLLFRLEMNQGKGWLKLLEGTMTRK